MLKLRQAVLVLLNGKTQQRIARFLQFRRYHIAGFRDIHREGNKGRRHIDLAKASGHAVLAADGRQAEAKLRLISA